MALSQNSIQELSQLSRAQFDYFEPSLRYPAFMENAGGSQVPRCVVNAVAHYMTHSYAQLGAGHAISARADATVAAARQLSLTLFNGHGHGQVALGPSTSRLLESLAHCYQQVLGAEDEVIIQESSHESNTGPWQRLTQATGSRLRIWALDTQQLCCPLDSLKALLSPATRIVAITHVSNLLGEVLDLRRTVALIRQAAPRARVVVDGVAYAPHRAMDVSCWGVDFYSFSNYKCWGPHMATLFVSDEANAELVAMRGSARSPNHYFMPGNLVYMLELGGVSHEGCAGLLGLQVYLRTLAAAAAAAAGTAGPEPAAAATTAGAPAPEKQPALNFITREEVEAAYRLMEAMEAAPQQLLLSFLSAEPGVRIIGPATAAPGSNSCSRVPTISFLHDQLLPSEVAAAVNAEGFAIRHGHMYAKRLVEALVAAGGAEGRGWRGQGAEAAVDQGVVRISLLHYNTSDEVERLIGVLRQVFRGAASAGQPGEDS